MSLTFATKFWSKVKFSEGDGCYVWTGNKYPCGYGQIRIKGIPQGAHRVSWMLAKGRIPKSNVLHRCDNRPCVRIDHLFLGNMSDNMLDCYAKNRRSAKGTRNPNSKISEKEVLIIRAEHKEARKTFNLWVSVRASLSRRFGLKESSVENIAYRKVWKFV